jgi:aldose 1-epimerase
VIRVTYCLEEPGTLRICYDAICDRDTVFNMTNHSYFNLAGHEKTEKAMDQMLQMPARIFCPDDRWNIPTGELRDVAGTPMDFREPKPLGQHINQDYEPLLLQGGYDHNFEVWCNPCAILSDPDSGRKMAVHTDCPGLQLYSGNYLNDAGKDGVFYPKRSGVALETQFYPDSVNHPEWKQPFTRAGERYQSTTKYVFSW